MAMTKKEQAAMEAMRQELREAKALRFTEPVEPDVDIPTSSERLSKGFLFSDYIGGYGHQMRVEPACSSSVHHAFGRDDQTTTQGVRRLYSTRLRALRACRHSVELKCAKILADIDEQIETESNNP